MGLELPILAAFGAMLSWGIGDFLIQRSTRRIGDAESLSLIGFIGAIGLLPFLAGDLALLFVPANLWLLLGLSGLVFVVSFVNFEALKKGKLSIVEVILEIELPITALLAFFVFQEALSLLEFGIVSLVFVGIVLAAFKGKVSRRGLERGVALAVLTAVGYGLVNFFTAVGARQASPLLVVWVPWLAIGLLSLVVVARREGAARMWTNMKRYRWLILVMGIVDTVAWLFYAVAVLGQEITVVLAITESYPAIGLLLGLWVNKEPVRHHQLIGGGLALASSVALALVV